MTQESSLLEFADENRNTIAVIEDRVAIWMLGYLLTYGVTKRNELLNSVEVAKGESVEDSLKRLIDAQFVSCLEGDELVMSEKGVRFAEAIGLSTKAEAKAFKIQISCDLFTIENVVLAREDRKTRRAIVNDLLSAPEKYFQGATGDRYGFVECNYFGSDIAFGYLTQEYLAHRIRYDENLKRTDEWPTQNYNVLFILLLEPLLFILQDTKFFGAPRLDMAGTRIRSRWLLQQLFDNNGVTRNGEMLLKPYERTLSREEMLRSLLDNEDPIVQAYLDLGNGSAHLSESLPVFNPKQEWNNILTEIINDFELPNIGTAMFNATRRGNIGKSMLVKALALSGQIKRLKVGRGKASHTVKETVPTHIGRVLVSDPPTNEDVSNILAFLQDNIGVSITPVTLNVSEAAKQMRFEI
jgi:hypothetical protein